MRSSIEGKVFQANVPPLKPDAHTPRGIPPIYVAGTGPVLQKMSGVVGDGLLTASITTPAFVRYSRKNMEEGARKAGKDPSRLVLGSVIVGSIGRDSAKGKEGAREQAAMYLANKVQNIKGSADVLLECAGLTFDELRPIADAMERGGRKAAAKAVTDDILRKVCPIAGTPEECIAAHRRISRRGLHPHHAGNLGRRSHRAGQAVWGRSAAALQETRS